MSTAYKFGSIGKKELRKTSRKKVGATAWIRLDGGFAVRSCRVIDLSDSGVQILLDAGQTIPSLFTLLMSRTAGSGRRARLKWRRGLQIGAEFI
jgi:hypothetical protein